jgi:hypothetical protein
MENTEAVPVPAASSGLSLTGLYEVLFSPGEFFKKLKDSPKLLVPWIVLAVGIFAAMYAMSDYIVEMQQQIAQEQGQDVGAVPPEIMKWTTIGGGTMFLLLYPLLAAAVALFWGNVVMAGMAKYRQLLSVMLYGEIIYLVGMLVTLPLIIKKGTVLVTISLAALVSPDPQNWLYLLLAKFSVWFAWEIIVVGLGFSAVYGFPRNKGMWLSVLTVGLLSMVHVAFMIALGGM